METVEQLRRMGRVAAFATLLIAAFAALVGSEGHAGMLSVGAMCMFMGTAGIAPVPRRRHRSLSSPAPPRHGG